MRAFAAFVVIVLFGSAALADAPSEKSKIDFLLNQLASSDITFIRNGEEHDGAWAKDHLTEKLKEANKPDMTAEEFIVNIGSKSSHTDKPYLIRMKNGKTMEAAEWFHFKLGTVPTT